MNTRPFFTGIGSRTTPQDILKVMYRFSKFTSLNLDVYTGDAIGADRAFTSARQIDQRFKIFDPSSNGIPGAGHIDCSQLPIWDDILKLAQQYHPAWHRLTKHQKALIARNTCQLLGEDLTERSRFVVCWTPDGAKRLTSRHTGGTGQAIRIAVDHNIPVYNLQQESDLQMIQHIINGTLPLDMLYED